ncbi:uncharacterized protein LOC124420657 [Lucilia cuprina]|uniref:uncharacterized protein LOC124420657 n=1 Tax=Lucilia cuprina TaxID=7375 RepID=UPI001F0520B6|nr:uncharacterized protein LOC124420657 [Lucilia cuprina]KAI8127160.1 hypothetical protein CVS40_3000 [Lucilia cuprina]
MKCINRSTLGLIVGGINIFGGIIAIIYIVKLLCELDSLSEKDKEENKDLLTTSIVTLYIILLICVIGIIISVLLIVGIMKKRHTLMKPWIYCSVASIVCQGFLLVAGLVMGLVKNLPFHSVFLSFIFGLITLGLQILIFYAIHRLYKDLRDASHDDKHSMELEAK